MNSRFIIKALIVLSLLNAVNAFGIMMLMPLVMGVGQGLMKGTFGSFMPIAKDGLGTMLDFVSSGLGGAMGGAGNMAGQAGGMAGGMASGLGNMFGGAGQAAQGATGDLTSMLGGMMDGYGGALNSMGANGGSLMTTIMGMLKGMLEKFFAMFGSLGGQAQGQIGNMYGKTSGTFNAVMHLKLNPTKNKLKIKTEMAAAKKVFETKFTSTGQLLKALKTKAPALTAATSLAYTKARAEYAKHQKALHPEAKKGLSKMNLVIANSKFGLSDIMGMMSGGAGEASGVAQGGIGAMMNMFQNLLSLIKMLM